MRKTEIALLAYEIWSLMGVSTKLMTRDMEQRLSEYCPGISLLQYGVLRLLQHTPFTLRELSDRMLVTPSTLVPVIDKLESEGLLVRGKDPDDRRRTPLELTERAREALLSMPEIHKQDRLIDALETMGPEKAHTLSQLLQDFLRQLDEDKGLVELVLSNTSQIANRIDRCSAKGALRHTAKPT